jgi:hypothetical protein
VICCRGHHVQTSLGVTRVVLVLVILRHCHAPLPDNSIQTGNLSRIGEVSLFKMEHSQTQKGPLTWKSATTPCLRPRRDRPRPGWTANTQSRKAPSCRAFEFQVRWPLRSQFGSAPVVGALSFVRPRWASTWSGSPLVSRLRKRRYRRADGRVQPSRMRQLPQTCRLCF